jgi:hypothetical protein
VVLNAPKGNHAIKWRCHRCRQWGDELDLLWRFHPDLNYPKRMALAAELREEFEATPFPPHGDTDQEMVRAREMMQRLLSLYRDEGRDPAEEFDWMERLWDRGLLNQWGYLPARIVACWRRRQEADAEHAAECDDDECNADLCRAKRGLPPMTEEERQRLIAEGTRKREESLERQRLTRETILRNLRRGR